MSATDRLTLSLDGIALGGRNGADVVVAVVDSGIAAGHPHVGAVADGVSLVADAPRGEWGDRIGHGTAVAGAIREKASRATLVSVRIFGTRLATNASTLVRAIEWSAARGARLVNLSLGTDNPAHEPALAAAVQGAGARGAIVVAAAPDEDHRWLPGALTGVCAVRGDPSLSRDVVRIVRSPLGIWLECSPYPRPIDGVPVARNLSGPSFAVANATGFLARLLSANDEVSTCDALLDRLWSAAWEETATKG